MKKLLAMLLLTALVFSLAPLALADGELSSLCDDPSVETGADDITGEWFIWAGGSLIPDYLVFRADGTFAAYDLDHDVEYGVDTDFSGVWKILSMSGTYAVTRYDPSDNLFWNDPEWMLTLTVADERIIRLGLNKLVNTDNDPQIEGRDCLQISDNEGAGGYLRFK